MRAEFGFSLGIAEAGADVAGEEVAGGGEGAGEPLVDPDGGSADAEGPPEETGVQDARATSNVAIVNGRSEREDDRTAIRAR